MNNCVVIDLQGFRTPDFVPKEMAIWDGERIDHYVFKEPFPFKYLSKPLQRQAQWLTQNYHKLHWTDGDVDVSRIPHILNDIRVAVVYCKGRMKSNYLKKYIKNDIVDLENIPRFFPAATANAHCFYHDSGVCAVKNVKLIYDYLLHPY